MSGEIVQTITVFSPTGHLFQVEYALEAVKKGSTAVGVKGSDICVLAVELKSTGKLQDRRTIRKILKIDEHVGLAFAGLTADARILVNKARVESQSYSLSYEDFVSVEYISKYIAKVQQKYTQSGGVRPFGISTLICGFDPDGTPQLFMTDPSGTFSSWKAGVVGRDAKTVREYLEKNHKKGLSDYESIKLAICALLEVVESGAKNIEVAILKNKKPMEFLKNEEIARIVKEIEEGRKKDEEDRKKRQKFVQDQKI